MDAVDILWGHIVDAPQHRYSLYSHSDKKKFIFRTYGIRKAFVMLLKVFCLTMSLLLILLHEKFNTIFFSEINIAIVVQVPVHGNTRSRSHLID